MIRATKEDVLRARAMGIALDSGDDKDAEIYGLVRLWVNAS